MSAQHCLVLRLAAPLQSWGGQTEFNRRETMSEPTKSGVLGLLAAAQGRRREDPIMDLLELRLGVRADRPGSLLRDYHTVSDFTGNHLRSTEVTKKGQQKRTKYGNKVTERYYLQDAAFVAAVEGPDDFLLALTAALATPTFPLALGRRACPPTQPLVLRSGEQPEGLWQGSLKDVLERVPWQERQPLRAKHGHAAVRLAATIDDATGKERRTDVPVTFAHKHREYTTRRVSRLFVEAPTGIEDRPNDQEVRHDPFALLGW